MIWTFIRNRSTEKLLGISLFVLIGIFIGRADQSWALNCVGTTPQMAIEGLQLSNQEYTVIKGSVQVDEKFKSIRESEDAEREPDRQWITRARVEGVDVRTGRRFNETVKVVRTCYSVWCGTLDNLSDVMIILTKSEGELVLSLNPCGGRIFGSYYEDDYKSVEQCLREGQCE